MENIGSSISSSSSALDYFTSIQDPDALKGHLLTIGKTLDLPNMKTHLRTHLIPADVNGIFQESKLADLLANLVTDYCIPREKRNEALEESKRTGSFEVLNALMKEAKDLFVENERSGEPGELLLYLLTEKVLGAKQIISKMVHKTSSQVHYHGADGVHAIKTESGLALYWGESKIHKSRSQAVKECLESVGSFLKDPDRKTASRDLGLIRDNLDVEGKEIKNELVRYFIKRNPEWNLLEFRASCLVGFDLEKEKYPKYITESDIKEEDNIHKLIASWSNHLSDNIGAQNLGSFEIDFFMIPFMDVTNFRKLTLSALG